MVISGNTRLAFKREFFAIKNLITATKLLIQRQKSIYLLDPKFISKQRKFPTSSNPAISSSRPRDSAFVFTKKTKAFIPVAPDISMETLDDILKPIEQEASFYSENVSTENIKTDNLGYLHTVTFLHGFVLFHNPKGIPIYFQTIENDAKTLPCAHSLREYKIGNNKNFWCKRPCAVESRRDW